MNIKDKIAVLLWRYHLQVTVAAAEMIADASDGNRWLHEPCPQLGGRPPFKAAVTWRGTAEVLRVLKYLPGPSEGLAHLRMVARP